MACCALAAFIVSQLLLALDFVRERLLGLAPPVALANANAAWRLGDAAPLPLERRAQRRVGLALAGGALGFAVAYGLLHADAGHRPHALAIPYLCTSKSGASAS